MFCHPSNHPSVPLLSHLSLRISALRWFCIMENLTNFFSYPIIFFLIVSAFKNAFLPFASFLLDSCCLSGLEGMGEHMGKSANFEIRQTYGGNLEVSLGTFVASGRVLFTSSIPSSVKMKWLVPTSEITVRFRLDLRNVPGIVLPEICCCNIPA